MAPGLSHNGCSWQNLQTLTNCLHLSALFVPRRSVISEHLQQMQLLSHYGETRPSGEFPETVGSCRRFPSPLCSPSNVPRISTPPMSDLFIFACRPLSTGPLGFGVGGGISNHCTGTFFRKRLLGPDQRCSATVRGNAGSANSAC